VNVLSVLATFGKNSKFNPLGFISDKRFNFFERVICQSQDMLDDFKKNYNIKNEKLIVINNPITDDFTVKGSHKKNNPINFITVARFDLEKGHPRILKVLSKLSFPFHYTLIGSGKQEEAIFHLIEKYNLKDKITHIPFTKEVAKYLSKNDIYLQGSYVEGFPNAVIESCMVGTPVVAFNAPGGINEIIIQNVNGKIVENIDQFIEALEILHKNYPFNPVDVSASVNKKYSSKTIIKQYETLFIQVYEKRKISNKIP
ncbi:MAG: glycosyltransferase, partial [Gelidibacter sp.]